MDPNSTAEADRDNHAPARPRSSRWLRLIFPDSPAHVFVIALTIVGSSILGTFVYEFYPFSVYNMYSDMGESSATRIVALKGGDIHEPNEFSAWACGDKLTIKDILCQEFQPFSGRTNAELNEINYVNKHPLPSGPAGAATEEVKLIRRVWKLDREKHEIRFRDCLIRECRAIQGE